MHVFASGGHEWVGWGGMLTFLVLLLPHVDTLHQCLVVLHLCIHCRIGPQCLKVDTWVASACVRRSWRGGVGLKDLQRAKIFSSVKAWQWRYVNLHAHLQQKTISTLKRLLWKERKRLSTCSNEMNPKPTRKANFAKLSRENWAQFGLQKCLFRFGENAFFLKNIVFTSTVPGPPGCLCIITAVTFFRGCQYLGFVVDGVISKEAAW